MKKNKLKNKRSHTAALMIVILLFAESFQALAGMGTGRFMEADTSEGMASGSQAEEGEAATSSEPSWDLTAELSVTPAELYSLKSVSSLGDIWDNWSCDFSFLDGNSGNGSEKHPYQIRTRTELMGLSQLAAMGMRVQPGEGDSEIVGSYAGKYFQLAANVDLGGMEWIPIGFYGDSSEFSGDIVNPFCGFFDGNGKGVSNYKTGRADWPNVGFFGAVEDGGIKNLTLNPGKTVNGKKHTAVLSATAVRSRIYNCSVSGNISAEGTAGGITASAEGGTGEGTVIENCTAKVTIYSGGKQNTYVGGIAGKAAGVTIVDCRVETGDNNTSRIHGQDAYVGGIVGFQNNTDIYNSYVSGTIGGVGTKAVGGITGVYGSGRIKVARFEGQIGQSGMGTAGYRGSFIGYREAGNYFRYGADVAYLFADAEEKIAFNVCGSEIPDDNLYTYGAHIGFSHKGNNFFTLVQGGKTKENVDTYYYEELEKGILTILDDDLGGSSAKKVGFEVDHFAPNDAGRPVRGYLISVPQVDTISSGISYYDVAALEVRGNNTYYRTIDKSRRGAVEARRSVTVTTAPRDTAEEKFQMDGVPTFGRDGKIHDTSYVGGGVYRFIMPEADTEVSAVYKKVAVKVAVVPSSYHISVVEERTGNRKNPTKTTRVTDNEGKLIATYINGALEQGTQLQPVNIQAVVDTNNDVADNSVKWSIDDPELISLKKNDDEDGAGYTKKSASIKVNLNASFFADTIKKLEAEQADKNYQHPIPDTIYGAGHQSGGIAVLTAATRPAASFEGKPCTGNSKVNVTFQVKDKTYVANEGAALDKASLEFVVTRKLTGNRKTAEENIQVTAPQNLSASFYPDFFDKKDINWMVNDTALMTVNGEHKAASVAAKKDAKWIQDIIAADAGIHANDPYEALNGTGTKSATVSVIADDMLGNRQTAECPVTIRFVTEDLTKVYVEGVTVNPVSLSYDLTCIKTGKRNNPTVTWTGTEAKKLSAFVYPEMAFNRNYSYQVSDDSLSVDEDGNITVNTNAKWIQAINQASSYSGSHVARIRLVTEDGGFPGVCSVTLSYKLTDKTTSSPGGSSGGGGGGGGGASSGVSPSGGVGPAAGTASATAPAGSVTGTWINTADGLWAFAASGRTYTNEWAYIHNPYAAKDQRSADWFRFDATGHMLTGWFTDEAGNVFYLSPLSDGTRGHMVTGWNWIVGADGLERCYYFNPVSDGTRGTLLKGVTDPDGNKANAAGEMVINGVVQVKVAASAAQ